MRTFRAISIAEAFREQLMKVEDHSTFEHNIACYHHAANATHGWHGEIRRNHPKKPCPGNLWPFS